MSNKRTNKRKIDHSNFKLVRAAFILAVALFLSSIEVAQANEQWLNTIKMVQEFERQDREALYERNRRQQEMWIRAREAGLQQRDVRPGSHYDPSKGCGYTANSSQCFLNGGQ